VRQVGYLQEMPS